MFFNSCPSEVRPHKEADSPPGMWMFLHLCPLESPLRLHQHRSKLKSLQCSVIPEGELQKQCRGSALSLSQSCQADEEICAFHYVRHLQTHHQAVVSESASLAVIVGSDSSALCSPGGAHSAVTRSTRISFFVNKLELCLDEMQII